LEDFTTLFDKLKPVLEDFINQKNQLEKQITHDGTLPDFVLRECLRRDVLQVQRFPSQLRSAIPSFRKWYGQNEMLRIESDGNLVRIVSKLDKIEGKKGTEIISQDAPSLDRRYQYTFDLNRLQGYEFYPLLGTYPFFGYTRCNELKESSPDVAGTPVIVTMKQRNGDATPILKLLCDDCDKRIEHICHELSIRRDGQIYRCYHTHDHILMRNVLKNYGIESDQSESSPESLVDRSIDFMLPKFQAMITDKRKKDLEDLVSKVKPSIVISPGAKKDIAGYLGLGCHVILYDESAEGDKEKFTKFDKSRIVEQDDEKCCQVIAEKLDSYIEQERGKEHDRIIESLGRIGRELGFVSQREVTVKGSKVDLVWMQRDGSVFGSIEVETKSDLKKDVITTWELEPKLAIIVGHFQTDKSIMDMLTYSLLKYMEHKLLLINNTTKKAYFIFKQELLKVYDVRVSQKGTSDVAEL
jgi:hypothetical protein